MELLYFKVFNKDVSMILPSKKQFSILYGHKGGSGSLGKLVLKEIEKQNLYMDRC